nr:tyrosine-type recombinase/integrase [Ruminococcus sp.]
MHSFRHTFASLLVNQGVDIVTVSGALGHSAVSTTSNIYCHMLDEARAKITGAISTALDFSNENRVKSCLTFRLTKVDFLIKDK